MLHYSKSLLKAICLFVLILSAASKSTAATDPSLVKIFDGRIGGMLLNTPLENVDLIYDDPVSRARINLNNPQYYSNTITLLIDELNNNYITSDFKAEITFDIEYTNLSGNVVQLPGKKLTVDYKQGAGLKYNARQYFHFTDGRKVKLTITNINKFGTTWDVTKFLILENRMDITRDYNFDTNETVFGLVNNGSAATVDELKISWNDNPLSGLTHYDVEWSWIDANVISAYQSGTNFNADLIFPDNSTRVTITNDSPEYHIPTMYDGDGYLFYRVRPVQYLVDGRVVTGTWSANATSNLAYFQFSGHQTNLNWQATTSYAEEGKRKTVVQYYDGTLRGRQTVTKDNTSNTAVIAETMYDYQGRPAIQVLPSPTLSNIIQYAEGFNRFETNQPSIYQKDIYDLIQPGFNVCNTLTAKLDNTSGTSQYYSTNNTKKDEGENKYIPDAAGYPYTETRYSQDATGRIVAQGGVSPVHQLGTGRETKYFYGSANQKELDALFGTEVGEASHYFKNMVRDANGQYSVSYVDMNGKTIATALAGDAPSSLNELPSHAAMNATDKVTEDLLTNGNNIVQGKQIIATKTLLVPKTEPYIFNYQLSPQSAEILACNPEGERVCYDCLYDLEIRITDNCGVFQRVINRTNFSLNSNPDISCNNAAPSITVVNEQITLPEGEYNIVKTLSLSSAAQDWYRENIFRIKNVCTTLQDYYDSTFQVMNDESDCAPTCATCTAALGTYEEFKSHFLAELGLTTSSPTLEPQISTAFAENSQHCAELCQQPDSKLEGIRMQMLADMTPPNGQYATQESITKPYNIYHHVGFFNFSRPYKRPKAEAGNYDFYRNNLNEIDPDAHGSSYPYQLQFTNPDQFESLFKDEWAVSLLAYHPEYCKYETAKNTLGASYHFDEQLESIVTYADANGGNTSGINYIQNILYVDPFFTGPGAGYVAAMKENIENVLSPTSAGYSMWQVAWMSINCVTYATQMDPSCANMAPKKPPFATSSCTGDWNRIWQVFRNIYISKKNDYVEDYLNSICPPGNMYDVLSQNGYQRRFGKANAAEFMSDEYMNTLSQPPYTGAPVQDSITHSYEITCESYRSMWMQDLMNCDQISNMPSPDRENLLTEITDKLKDVCIRGSDLYHFLGSASEIPGDPRQYDDFEQALTDLFAQHNISLSTLCHPYLISYPKKYDTQTPASEMDVVLQKDTCVCNKLSEVRLKQSSDGYIGTLSQYLQYKYGITISQGLLDTLTNGCKGVPNCQTYDPAFQIPAFLTCYGTATETCIGCRDYSAHLSDFHSQFPESLFPGYGAAPYDIPETPDQTHANEIFQQYMNYQTGFNKHWSEYIQFGKACKNYNTPYDCIYLDSIVTAFQLQYSDTISGPSCQALFVQYFNQQTGNFYTWQDIEVIFMQACGHLPEVCNAVINCDKFESTITGFMAWYAAQNPKPDCRTAFVNYFNSHWGTSYTWDNLVAMYKKLCRKPLDICDQYSCRTINEVIRLFQLTNPWLYPDCQDRFIPFFNNYFQTNLSADDVWAIVAKCDGDVNLCGAPVSCITLENYITSYFRQDVPCTSTADSGSQQYCSECFTHYIDSLLGFNYTYEQIALMYLYTCKGTLKMCGNRFDCGKLSSFYKDFTSSYTGSGFDCQSSFVTQFNATFGTTYTYDQIVAVYLLYCNEIPAICKGVHVASCDELTTISTKFTELYPDPAGYFGYKCQLAFEEYFYAATGDSLSYADIMQYYIDVCGSSPDICSSNNCQQLNDLLQKFQEGYGAYHFPQALNVDLFTLMYNNIFQPKAKHYWKDIARLYANCGIPLNIAPEDVEDSLLTCERLAGVKEAYYYLNPGPVSDDCAQVFEGFINLYYGVKLHFADIINWANDNCGVNINPCSDGTLTDQKMKIRPSGPDVPQGIMPPRLCGLNQPVYPAVVADTTSDCSFTATLAWNSAVEQYNIYVQNQLNNFDIAYQAKCMGAKSLEHFTVSYVPTEYHYTLYYYDQAGSLVKTVPPEGVHPNYSSTYLDAVAAARANGTTVAGPAHTMITQYRYNSLGQVTAQKTPDAGISRFWYDRLGRLVISQNAKQAAVAGLTKNYSYTQYDPLGRIIEVGQKPQNDIPTQSMTQDNDLLNNWLAGGGMKEQLTHTVYDEAFPPWCGGTNNLLCQRNMRNRVSYTYIAATETDPMDPLKIWDAATFYSYDEHGNVDILLQDYYTGAMRAANNRWKKMEYKYDLISGKVNEVAYQAGQSDAFYHRYSYDAENRLTSVETSADKIYWENDASYKYYRHGPLSRMVLGQNLVQGIDYAYTLQGWLKGVNASAVGNGNFDMGSDGKIAGDNALVSRDAYSFSLSYFANDYKAIGTNATPFAAGIFNQNNIDNNTTAKPLYNGNISSMFVNIPVLGNAALYGYQYDQLNRLMSMDLFNGFNNVSNNWGSITALPDYKERITYDANGNIKKYFRNGATAASGLPMDDLTYSYDYFDASGVRHSYLPGQTGIPSTARITNRLNSVADVAGGNYTEDIKTQVVNSYDYDETGNLIKDGNEGITGIDWNVYGKISMIHKGSTIISYTYDASGNRISKQTGTKTTCYVRDATGNVMSVYEKGGDNNNGHLTQTELHLYGSSRLGIFNTTRDAEVSFAPEMITFERGDKFFELANHLGNVLVTVSDKKIPHNNGSGQIDYYNADIITANDYYPFGMGMVGRMYDAGNGYRYGFNGKEKDKDITNGDLDFGARIYDNRLGRFLSVDPLTKKYASESPYCSFDNDPIDRIDPDGEGGKVTLDKKNGVYIATISSSFTFYGNGATLKKAKEMAAKIQKQWNAANGTAMINGICYKVEFAITADYVDISNPAAAKALQEHIKNNKDVSQNFFRIGTEIPKDYSYTDPVNKTEKFWGPGGNTGEFSPSDVTDDNTTTESHEHGHGLGEIHDDPSDQGLLIGKGQPGIMAARGTRVDAKYTYDPKKGNSKQTTGKDGKTINTNTVDPAKRVVTQENIDNLHLDTLQYNSKGEATIGNTTNVYHPDPPK